ncbi:hypothetical protein Ae201684_015600 [Aphanomyces euteiches]|uniref:Uncharacterized protein n=1 Tax=Aphanomyces euteiches TaxID=100861 RepID=A0A6G0WFC1_9STRA|nr:hypothetical protein Ae201684_015600 [Aphanomyces euteiches]
MTKPLLFASVMGRRFGLFNTASTVPTSTKESVLQMWLTDVSKAHKTGEEFIVAPRHGAASMSRTVPGHAFKATHSQRRKSSRGMGDLQPSLAFNVVRLKGGSGLRVSSAATEF